MAGEAYVKRYGAGGFVDLPAQTTSIDSQYLNGTEAALARLLGADPTDKGVQVWDAALGRFKTVLLTAANLDPAAAIAKSQLAPLAITDADIAAGANIAATKLGANIPTSKLVNPGDVTQNLQGDGTYGVRRIFLASSTSPGPASTSSTTFATAINLLSSTITFVADGTSSYLAFFNAAGWLNSTAAANNILALSFDGAEYNRVLANMAAAGVITPCTYGFFIAAPASGSHSVLFKLYAGAGTATMGCGAANTPANYGPMFGGVMRI